MSGWFYGPGTSLAVPDSVLPPEADPRFSYRNIRYNSSNAERNHAAWRSENTWMHVRPWSVLVAAMGNHWKPGCWQKVLDMVQYTNNQGFLCNLEEIMDRCFNPYDAMGAMRNEAVIRARQGYEYLMMVDNDVLPDPDTISRLMHWHVPIVAPYVIEPGVGRPLHGPVQARDQGLRQIRWCVLSMVLYRTTVFGSFPGGEFWNNAVGADEGYHFQKLWDVGHNPWVDTTLLLPVYQAPTYPLAANRMSKEDAEAKWDERKRWLLAPPDRAAIDPYDSRQKDGEYFPFNIQQME